MDNRRTQPIGIELVRKGVVTEDDIDAIKNHFGDFVKVLRKNKWQVTIIVTSIFKVNLSG